MLDIFVFAYTPPCVEIEAVYGVEKTAYFL